MEKSPVKGHWWDWAAIGLLFVLLQTVAARLVTTSWTPFLYFTQTFTYMGFVVGTALGYSRFKRATVRWLSFFYMLLMLPLQWTLIIDQRVVLEEQLLSVAGRLFVSTSDFLGRRPVEDPFFFVALMSIAFWIISSASSFHLVRNRNYLAAVVPAAIGLLIIQSYDNASPGRLWILAFFAFIALLLLGRLHFLQNQESWRERRVFLSPDNRVDLSSTMAIAAGLIILVSWTVPASLSTLDSAAQTWNRLTKPWRNFTQNMENAVEALEATGGGRTGEFFGTEIALGLGFSLSDEVVFSVDVPELPADAKPPRYYWRGRTYDYFTQGQWYTTGTTREEYSPTTGFQTPINAGPGEPSRFAFSTGDTSFSLLYSPAQPVRVSRPGSTLSIPAGAGRDVVSWSAFPVLLAGETYQVDAVLNNPTATQLREAGQAYPEWVRQYLQLPQEFSPRIRQLALDITADAETPYDKAVAITRYMRDNIEYSATVEPAPRNRDPLEWILFDYKKGYCVYYASSEIMMLRSLGIPARLAVGFAQGERADEDTFTVRRLHAHAWPEVYFPGAGWVEFEPTGNQAPLSRPVGSQDSQNGDNAAPRDSLRIEDSELFAGRNPFNEEGVTLTSEPAAPNRPLLYVLPFLGLLGVAVVFLSRRYSLPARAPAFLRVTMERTGIETPAWVARWERWVTLSPIERAFESINFGLRQLDESPPVHATPAERAHKLSGILTPIADQIKVLLDEHHTSLYTSRTANINEARRAALNIRLQAVLARLRRFLTGKYVTDS